MMKTVYSARHLSLRLMLGSVFSLAFTFPAAYGQTKSPVPSPLAAFNESLVALAEKTSPAVVQIFSTGFGIPEGQDLLGAGSVRPQRNTGSGVFVHPEGYIVTTAHLIAGAQRVRVLFTLPSEGGGKFEGSIVRPPGRIMDAKVLGYDLESDLAVLKIEAKVLRYLRFADSSLIRKGQLVFALGNPRRMEEGMTMGVVSSAARQIDPSDPMIYIQTDANINEGNSGGPLVDIDGNIVGISNFKASQAIGESGFGLAAPSNIVRPVYEQVRENGRVRRGIIGVMTQTINPLLAASLKLSQDGGVLVVDVIPTSPADLAGIRAGDIIYSLDGKVMENALQFNFHIYQRKVGDQVNLDILRAGEKRTLRAAVFERPDIPNRLAQLMDQARTPVPPLAIVAADIDEKTMGLLPFFRDSQGVLIASLLPGSLAQDALKPGDLIHAIDTVAIRNLAELTSELGKRRKGDIVFLYIERQMQYRYVLVELQ